MFQIAVSLSELTQGRWLVMASTPWTGCFNGRVSVCLIVLLTCLETLEGSWKADRTFYGHRIRFMDSAPVSSFHSRLEGPPFHSSCLPRASPPL